MGLSGNVDQKSPNLRVFHSVVYVSLCTGVRKWFCQAVKGSTMVVGK